MGKALEYEDGRCRCTWATPSSRLYVEYHDSEWGRPVSDDRRLFEKICLEGFQAGLSWLTILNKRENFRRAFDGFDFEKIALYGEADVQRLLADVGIVRHRGKIESTINNASKAIELSRQFGSLAAYFWSFEPDASQRPSRLTQQVLQAMTTSPQSVALSRDLKRRGWSFVGPTTVYAFMQAMGLVNDHSETCWVRDEVLAERRRFSIDRRCHD